VGGSSGSAGCDPRKVQEPCLNLDSWLHVHFFSYSSGVGGEVRVEPEFPELLWIRPDSTWRGRGEDVGDRPEQTLMPEGEPEEESPDQTSGEV
jgi:hypothetical protein